MNDSASRVHTANLSLVDAAGHLIHYDAPIALTSEIRAWLDPMY